jgi:hypothetical protein
MSQTPPILHLALPGLLWPAQAMQDMVFDLQLPALSWLLGKGSRRLASVNDSQQWLANVAGLTELPASALRASAEQQAQTGRWLCLDPIHLRVERTQLIVEDPAALQLTAEEAAALLVDLAPLLEDLGDLHSASPGEWQLHLHSASNIRTTPLADAIGLNGDQLMPKAGNVKVWRRVLNEVQITLHEHPVNTERTARGLPAVNSLWPWGEGELNTNKPDWQLIQGDGLLWHGLAQHLGCKWTALPERYVPNPGKALVVQPALEIATRQRDAMRWRMALQELEQNWFAPMMQALQSGQLKQLVLHGYGEGQTLSITISGSNRLSFWRKPAPLTALSVGEIRPLPSRAAT